jgi:hypothetical protein
MLGTDARGAIAESAVVHAAARRGFRVFRPITSDGRYDLVFDLGGRLLRVQCKSARQRDGVLLVQCHTARRTGDGFRKRAYGADEIDVIVAFDHDSGRCYVLTPDAFAGRKYVQLRLIPARNHQRAGVRWAHELEFESLDWDKLAGP